MPIPKSKLMIKRSTLPRAGKGLFTNIFIPKETRIIEYKGTITTWQKVNHNEGKNGYIYYVTRNYVIDAGAHPNELARYANDATGLVRVKGFNNNAVYTEKNKKVFITAVKDIPAGAEIFVTYGKEYWDIIRHNRKIDSKSNPTG
jgi:SET domain-containing protein